MSTEKNNALRENWDRYLVELEPHRQRLFRYCLKLTRNPFDAEDLVSETLIKTFGSRGFIANNVETPLAFMLRVASRTWIDECRRHKEVTTATPVDVKTPTPNIASTVVVGEAAGVLYDQLMPIQRAVFVLKEVFDMSHKEIARLLSISPENSRVTLHRSKNLMERHVHRAPRASKELVQRFVNSFMSHDIDQIKALLLDDVEATVFPMGHEVRGTGELEWLKIGLSFGASDLQVRDVLGDQVILVFRTSDDGPEALEEVWLLEESDGKIARIIDYGASPILVGWVAEHCGVTPRDARFRFSET